MYSVADRYSRELIQELEGLYPGPYLVYYVKEKNKVGCTRQSLEDRHIQMERYYGESLSLPKVLFETNDLLMAAEKERENKAIKGIQWDTTDYVNDLKRQAVSCRKEVRKKAFANRDFAKEWTKEKRKKMSQRLDPVKNKVKVYKVIEVQWIGKKGIDRKKIVSKKKYFRTFESMTKASEYFRKKGLNVSAQDISLILNPKYGHTSRHGYTFKLA